MRMSKNLKTFFALGLIFMITAQSVSAIEDTQAKKTKFSFFKRTRNEVKLEKKKEPKKVKITEVELPPVFSFKNPPKQISTMTIEDCVKYAIEHNPNLSVFEQRIKAAKAGIGEARGSYAPRLTARVNYNHLDNSGSRIASTHTNSGGFTVGISDMIWDFGKTTARINMAKYDTKSAQYDYEYELLDVIYRAQINYYYVLSALANLDIF